MLIFPALGALSLLGLLWSEARGQATYRAIFKTSCSLLFVLTGLAAGPETSYGWLMMAGLILGAAGDVFLLSHAQRWFLAGLVVFLLGHVLYVLAFGGLMSLREISLIAWLLPGLLSLGVFAAMRKHFGALLGPVAAYFIVITLMLVLAWGIFAGDEGQPLRVLVACGATAFYFSDLAVALDRFVQPAWKNAYWGLPLYYAGQFALALSIGQG